MTEKMTYVKALEFAMSQLDRHEVDSIIFEKLEALKTQLEKRNSSKGGEKKPTKTQRENEGVKVDIVDILTNSDGMRCGDIAKALDISSQKCSALLKQLKDAGKVVTREGEKRVTLFALAEGVCGDSFIDPYEM